MNNTSISITTIFVPNVTDTGTFAFCNNFVFLPSPNLKIFPLKRYSALLFLFWLKNLCSNRSTCFSIYTVCTLPFLLGWGGVGVGVWGFTGSQSWEGGCCERGGDFFQGGCSFFIKNKLKSEIFNDKKL